MVLDGSGSWVEGWHECRVRVRYPEVDPQGVVHHAAYLLYFEDGRTEMLRALGIPYARIESGGTRLMVIESRLRHLSPARYDDLLRVRTRVAGTTRTRIFIEYRILTGEGERLLCEGSNSLVAVDLGGKPRALPDLLREKLNGDRRPQG